MECKFSDLTHGAEGEVKIEELIIPKRGSFKYLESIIQGDEEIDHDVVHRMGAGR